MEILLLFLVAALSSVCPVDCALESVPDLEKTMYKVIDGTPCVRLLNLYGESGCANPGREKVVAPIYRLTTLEIQSKEPVTILLPYSLFHMFLEKTVIESSFSEQVAAVLVEFEHNLNYTVVSNPDKKFPQAEFAPYKEKDYPWNPSGTEVLQKRYNFPVYLLSQQSTKLLREIAVENESQNTKYPVNVAEFDLVMQTTKSGTHTSQSCLKQESCLPLGGYSVWSALPPINVSSISSRKPFLLVMTAMDSASFFRDFTPGADSPLSGLIALLAAVDALSKMDGLSNMSKQVVFLVCTGESWGYLGSRRFLLELEAGKASVAGLNASRLHQVIEVGSVGRALHNTFYAHSQEKEVSPDTQEILNALKRSAQSLDLQLQTANRQNPGIPPSSLMAFLQKNSSLAGVVLEEFDTAFTNNFFHSHLDDAGNANHEAITAAASLLARTIYQLGNSDLNISSSNLQLIAANSSLVQELVGCLLTTNPGMECELVKNLITPTQAVANHYVGVFLGDPSGPPLIENVDDTTQFVWNFLADRTKKVDADLPKSTECSQTCKDPNQACVGSTAEHKGACAFSTTRYVPAFSTRLKYDSGGWELLPVEAGDIMDSVDPVWTESFWKSLTVRVYLQENPAMDRLILFVGCIITIASVFATLTTQAVFRKRLKRA